MFGCAVGLVRAGGEQSPALDRAGSVLRGGCGEEGTRQSWGWAARGGFAVLQQLLQRMVRMRKVTPRVATPVTLSCPGGPHSGFPFPPDSVCSLLGWKPLEYLTGGFVESLFTVPVQN